MSAGPRTMPPLPVESVVVDRWIRAGFLHLSQPGTGRRRVYPPGEVRAIVALDCYRRLGGADPEGVPLTGPARALILTLAHLARSHEPGTAHEITTPVPWIRHILIVPEP